MVPSLPKPACYGMSRAEITSLLDSELVRMRLEKPNRYSFWAHEVWLDRYSENQKRVDFVEFLPLGGVMYSDGAHIEHGTFTFYEVKSCLADLKSGNGLNFEGDRNYLVMPIEMREKFIDEIVDNANGYVAQHTRHAECLYYGIGKNGKPTFFETESLPERWFCRRRSSSELLFCMMRAMIANSGHSDVDHRVGRGGTE